MKFSPEAEGWRRKRNERSLLRRYGGLAQLGERLPCKQEVAGSIPTISTNFELKMDGSGQEVVRFDLVSSETGNCTLKTEQ